MSKKRKPELRGVAETRDSDPSPPDPRRGRLGGIAVFAAGFAAAFFLAWLVFSPREHSSAPASRSGRAAEETRVLTAGDLAEFFRAVDNQNFAAMSRLGGELFRAGTVVGNHAELLARYAVDSFPPHQVYALFTRLGRPKSYRVLLTMEEDKVVSFMAEETTVSGSGT